MHDDDVGADGNLHRLHLLESQRGMVAARIADLNPGDNQHTKEVGSIELTSKTQREAAAMLNVGTSPVMRLREIAEPKRCANLRIENQDRNAVMLWMLDNQGGRRNLADIDRIGIAARKSVIIAAQAKERQQGGQGGLLLAKSPEANSINTRAESAKDADVGEKKYDEGKIILDAVASGEAPKELLEQVRAGQVSVHKAEQPMRKNCCRNQHKFRGRSVPQTL